MTIATELIDLGPFGTLDPSKVATIMAEICAAEMLPRFRNLSDDEISLKGPNDPVTVVDRACEHLLERRLGDLLDNAGFVGEEACSIEPARLDLVAQDGPVWIVDPLDGTANFARGNAEFGMIVALVVDGETKAGWIHLPLEPRTYLTVKGRGAISLTGQSLATAPVRPIEDQYGQFNFPSAKRSPALSATLKDLAGRIRRHDLNRCSAYAYCGLADGTIDFVLYQKLKPWDHAAGILMVGEAGGASAHLATGEPYRPTDSHGPLVTASSSEVVAKLRESVSADA